VTGLALLVNCRLHTAANEKINADTCLWRSVEPECCRLW
jgi:hypothetical protein